MGSKRLTEVLKGYDIANEKNQRICILAGVGAGKNFFIENELVQYGNILYISSRRAKVDEILENNICGKSIHWDKETGDIVSTTNYGIELLVQNKLFEHNLRQVISHFNYVVVDEAHSLFTDATYANSSYHVFAFIEYIAAQYPHIKIILMTGTPTPLAGYLKQKRYTIYDKREECIHVLPKVIRIVDKDFAFNLIASMPETEKTIYYTTSASSIVMGNKSLIKRLNELGFTDDDIGICVSDRSIKKLKKVYPHIKDKCEKTRASILKSKMLDKDCRILLTTSCLKEGINIKNKNVKIAFCESHVLSEIRQFAGRVRDGLEVLYIISNAKQHSVTDDELHHHYLELHYSIAAGRRAANEYLANAVMDAASGLYFENNFYDRGDIDIYSLYEGEYSLARLGGSIVPMYVQLVESSNQYLKFNHMTGKFDVFANRYIEQRRINKILSDFTWLENISEFAQKHDIEYLEKEIQNYVSEEEIIEYCEELTGTIWVGDDKKVILDTLRYLMLLAPNASTKTINKNLSMFRIPYQIKQTQTSRKGTNIRGFKILEAESL